MGRTPWGDILLGNKRLRSPVPLLFSRSIAQHRQCAPIPRGILVKVTGTVKASNTPYEQELSMISRGSIVYMLRFFFLTPFRILWSSRG